MKALILAGFILGGFQKCQGYQTRYNDLEEHKFSRQTKPDITYMQMIQATYKEGYDIIQEGTQIALKSRFCVPFEVGYIFCSLQERYRRMVEKYETARVHKDKMYLMEEVLYLNDIEMEYWTIEHTVNSLKQLERKYLIFNYLTDPYKDTVLTRRSTSSLKLPNMSRTSGFNTKHRGTGTRSRSPKLKHASDFFSRYTSAATGTKKKNKRFWWPLEYGWEIDWDWNDEPNFKKDILYHQKADLNFTVTEEPSYEETEPMDKITTLIKPHDALKEKIADQGKKILDELTWPLRLILLKDMATAKDKPTTEHTRRVGMQALMQHRRADSAPENDESNMKMKLFRLMYETVRENDLKTKRAELIKVHYSNSTSFEIGYLMGDVMDKYNVMSDIALTLKRLYNDWKPLEHINAYEQIANQAIEISHIIEMINNAANKNSATEKGETETTTAVTETTTLPAAAGIRKGPQ